MSLSFVCLILVTLFKINTSAKLTDEQRRALQREIYFIHPEFSEELSVEEDHAYHGSVLGSIPYILNQIQGNYAFKETKLQYTLGGELKTHDVVVFEHKIEHRARGKRGSTITTIHYHCYIPWERAYEEPLIIFYDHIINYSKDELFVFKSKCRMHIDWFEKGRVALGGKSTTWINTDKLKNLYVRVADDNKRILYLTNRARRLKSYDFWKARSYMFDDLVYFDHSFVFNPVMIRYQSELSEVEDPCNDAKIVAHQGIVLVDILWGDSGYLTAECLKNIHLKNIAKQWREIWRPVEPLELTVGGSRIEPRAEVPNDAQPDGTPSPPTKIETSLEVMQRTQSIPPITWNECALLARRGYIRECTIKSVGRDCVCDPPPREDTKCAHHCSKILYLMPSVHGDKYRSADLRKLIDDEPNVKFVATELNSLRFKVEFEDLFQYRGDYSEPQGEMVEACRVAMDPRNVHIKKLVLADLEPNYIYSTTVRSLLQPKNNEIYPIWRAYYEDIWVYTRNNAMVPTINGIVYSEMEQSEAMVLPIGMFHYDPMNSRVLDVMAGALAGALFPADMATDKKVAEIMRWRESHKKQAGVFCEYFGQGMKDLLEHPEKVKTAYKFRTSVRRAERGGYIPEWTNVWP